ncbi:Rhodanese-like protein [Anaeromyces robustus]|uniref:Rhodanese-like protein n=1 Tax=Anaeromyces robustus TaxID=1754192 RepID=A0A1Y1WNX7_9FUNG|nr:Rhodanese-like protein [Anaeromyces robustus]|eukprot:ORX75237.1 Rhodanese-like protein [Anaeromyces robustus]
MGNVIKGITDEDRISVEEYNEILKANTPHILIDVRPETAFSRGSLPNAINIPKAQLADNADRIKELLKNKAKEVNQEKIPLYLICRSSFTTSLSIPILRDQGITSKDIKGGLLEWKKKIDPGFPI